MEHSPLFACNVNSAERPEKKQEKETDRIALVARCAGRGGAVVAVVADGGSSSLLCFAASSSSVSIFSVFLLLFLTV